MVNVAKILAGIGCYVEENKRYLLHQLHESSKHCHVVY